MPEIILIAGGTGLVGKAAAEYFLQKGHSVIIVSRNKEKAKKAFEPNTSLHFAEWNTEKKTIDENAIGMSTVIINLAGAGVMDKRWNEAYKKEIVDSRLNASSTIIKALQETTNKVKLVINASAIGFYGHDNGKTFTEDDQPDKSFLGETCRQWEASILPVGQLNKRLAIIRIGIVLSTEGGALKEFLKPIKFGLATIFGNGQQVISWLHITDLVRMFEFTISNENIHGIYNAVAPNPVTNKQLITALAKAIKGNMFIPVPVPAFVLKLMLGQSSVEVLRSVTVSAQKIKEAGFQFLYPSIETLPLK